MTSATRHKQSSPDQFVFEFHDLRLLLQILWLIRYAAVEVTVGDVRADHGRQAVFEEVALRLLRFTVQPQSARSE
jgi:hypothetical protein